SASAASPGAAGPGLFVAPASEAPSPSVSGSGPGGLAQCVVAAGPASSRSLTVRAVLPSQGQPGCDGGRLRVFWAVYRLDPTGAQHLYRSQVHYLDPAHNPVRLTYQVPACPWAIYVVAGDQQILGSIPAMLNFASQVPTAYSAAGVLYVHEQPCPTAVTPRPSATLAER
ncbi:MAG: hypothetical protein J2P15_22395, partial [Micromonosporaceae bacterium]|nr:hypothetical protein [Micromonosporaceae bacterium]